MKTELQEVIERASKQLDEPAQHEVASQLFKMIEAYNTFVRLQQREVFEQLMRNLNDCISDTRWQQLLSSKSGVSAARLLAREAMADVAAGEVEEGGFAG